VLGAIILDNQTITSVATTLKPDDFFLPQNRQIFSAMVTLDVDGKPIDTISLMEQLKSSGTLESAGGVSYLSQLPDGLPKTTSVPHYAAIVTEKARLRRIIHTTQLIQQRALEDGADPKNITSDLADYAKHLGNGHVPALVSVDFKDLISMELPPRDFVIEPLLSDRGRGLIYSPRGAGKTYITMEIAFCVASGSEACFMWRIPRARKVVYVDGEMSIEELQERQRHIARMHDQNGQPWPAEGFLKMVARDLQKEMRPNINTREGRRRIEDCVEPGHLLILDNIASLGQSSDEKETEDWAIIEEWASDLCWRGISVIFIHHAGKSGDQRGSSKREDLMEFVLKLKVPGDYSPEQGLRVEAHLSKKRGKLTEARYGQPFEIALSTSINSGFPEWALRPLKELLRKRAMDMLADGMKPNDIAQETGLNRWAIYRLQKKSKGETTSIDTD
jgi:DnaB-like helicase N terminal domain/AAA domain